MAFDVGGCKLIFEDHTSIAIDENGNIDVGFRRSSIYNLERKICVIAIFGDIAWDRITQTGEKSRYKNYQLIITAPQSLTLPTDHKCVKNAWPDLNLSRVWKPFLVNW